jgi:hypothetical protein
MAADFTITAQNQTTTVTNGTFQEGMKVSFLTTKGVPGNIFVPLSQYNAENVAALVQARVDSINAVDAI